MRERIIFGKWLGFLIFAKKKKINDMNLDVIISLLFYETVWMDM